MKQNDNSRAEHYRPTVSNLITRGLGYCCVWGFFQLFHNTAEIALRLGVTTRAIRKAKASCENGECSCQNNPRCVRKNLKALRKRL